MEEPYKTIEVQDWEDLQRLLGHVLKGGGWLFRGQGDSDHELEPSILRYAAATCAPARRVESRVLASFRARAHHYVSDGTTISDTLECLALMQHFGAPTRLLDWTESPYVATLFAVEDAIKADHSSAVWVINRNWCYDVAADHLAHTLNLEKASALQMLIACSFSKNLLDLFMGLAHVDFVVPLEPLRQSERLALQRGMFLAPCNLEKSFLTNLTSSAPDAAQNIKKFIIPNSLRNEILEGLSYLTVSRATLFPGLDGFARSLRCLPMSDLAPAHQQKLNQKALLMQLGYSKEYDRIFGPREPTDPLVQQVQPSEDESPRDES